MIYICRQNLPCTKQTKNYTQHCKIEHIAYFQRDLCITFVVSVVYLFWKCDKNLFDDMSNKKNI